jgi:hypothetical protein
MLLKKYDINEFEGFTEIETYLFTNKAFETIFISIENK